MLTSSAARVCLYMYMTQEKKVWIPLTMVTPSVTFLASLKLGPELPSPYGLDCFVTTGVGTFYRSGAPEILLGL